MNQSVCDLGTDGAVATFYSVITWASELESPLDDAPSPASEPGGKLSC